MFPTSVGGTSRKTEAVEGGIALNADNRGFGQLDLGMMSPGMLCVGHGDVRSACVCQRRADNGH
jgi:hypothetical protein